jgi:hypothetical protein
LYELYIKKDAYKYRSVYQSDDIEQTFEHLYEQYYPAPWKIEEDGKLVAQGDGGLQDLINAKRAELQFERRTDPERLEELHSLAQAFMEHCPELLDAVKEMFKEHRNGNYQSEEKPH